MNIVNKKKDTPLMIAAQKGHAKSLKELIAAGANVNMKHKYGETALMVAKEAGADVNIKNV